MHLLLPTHKQTNNPMTWYVHNNQQIESYFILKYKAQPQTTTYQQNNEIYEPHE